MSISVQKRRASSKDIIKNVESTVEAEKEES